MSATAEAREIWVTGILTQPLNKALIALFIVFTPSVLRSTNEVIEPPRIEPSLGELLATIFS